MTPKEINELKKLHNRYQEEGKKAIKSFEEKEAKKQALLEKLGITEDEAKLLLS